jgi:hypothetical protein
MWALIAICACQRLDKGSTILLAATPSPQFTPSAVASKASLIQTVSKTPLSTISTSTAVRALPSSTPVATASASTVLATASPAPSAALEPSSTPAPTALPIPSETPPSAVTVSWGEVTINTYGYRQALYLDPAGIPYPRLHRDQVTPPQPQTYRVLKLSNGILELTFIPELGGRLYQCRLLLTGQDLFYNNTVIKPSFWGPVEQGWWLAAGGMEWCLPVEEHGYVSAEPWDTTVVQNSDGSATATMQITEKSRNIQVVVQVSLAPASSAFSVRTSLTNSNAEDKSIQYWINAMLAPGAHSVGNNLRLVVPATQVVVHSTGDSTLPAPHETLTWPIYQGRDLSYYRNWRNWLGFFAPELSANFTAVYDEQTDLGMARIFPSEIARGAKLFAFGAEFPDVGSYTDDGSKYIEMWGGLTPSFWDFTTLAAGTTKSWEETWYVLAGCGTPVLATNQVTLSASRQGSVLHIGLATPQSGQWRIMVLAAGDQILDVSAVTSPAVAFSDIIALPESANGKPLKIVIVDRSDRVVLSYILT